MPIKQATSADLAAMKERLKAKQWERQVEEGISEVIAMVNRHGNPTQPVLAEAVNHPQEREKMGIRQITLMGAWIAIEALKALRAEDWLFILVLAVLALVFGSLL